MTKSELLQLVREHENGYRNDVFGLLMLAADKDGRSYTFDIEAHEKGELLPKIEKRRKDRSDVLPLKRGGPIS